MSPAREGKDQLLSVQFFQSQFVVFDWGNHRMGFAKHADAEP
jgi:hypothetical protein